MFVRLETACRRKIQYAHINIAEGILIQMLLSCRQHSHETSELLVAESPGEQLPVIHTPFMDLRAHLIQVRRILNEIYKRQYHIQEQ